MTIVDYDKLTNFFSVVDKPILDISRDSGVSRQTLYNLKKGYRENGQEVDFKNIRLDTALKLYTYMEKVIEH